MLKLPRTKKEAIMHKKKITLYLYFTHTNVKEPILTEYEFDLYMRGNDIDSAKTRYHEFVECIDYRIPENIEYLEGGIVSYSIITPIGDNEEVVESLRNCDSEMRIFHDSEPGTCFVVPTRRGNKKLGVIDFRECRIIVDGEIFE
jgi:hypothetical protein